MLPNSKERGSSDRRELEPGPISPIADLMDILNQLARDSEGLESRKRKIPKPSERSKAMNAENQLRQVGEGARV